MLPPREETPRFLPIQKGIFKNLSFADSLLLAAAKESKANLLTFEKSLQKVWLQVQ